MSNIASLKPFKKGEDSRRNIKGKPAGSRSYRTIYLEALKKIAEANDKTPEEMEELIEQTGLKQALKGNFAFWKDIRDRAYGPVTQKTDVTAKVDTTNSVANLTNEQLEEIIRNRGKN